MRECMAPCGLCENDNDPCTLSWNTSIDELEFSVRADRICREQGIKTLRDLHSGIDWLEGVKGCGYKTIEELERGLEELMLRLFFDKHGNRREAI